MASTGWWLMNIEQVCHVLLTTHPPKYSRLRQTRHWGLAAPGEVHKYSGSLITAIITFFMSISDPLLIIMAIIWRRRLAFSFILLPPSRPNSDYRVQLWNNISVWRWKIVSSDTLLRHQQTACGQFATWSPFVSVTVHSTLGWSRKEDDMNSNYGFLIDVAYSFLCTGLVGHCGLVILVHYDT